MPPTKLYDVLQMHCSSLKRPAPRSSAKVSTEVTYVLLCWRYLSFEHQANFALKKLCQQKSNSPDHIFILSRALFLSTASGTLYIESVVNGKYHGRSIVEIIGSKLDFLTTSIYNGASMAREAMTDLLKFTFNLLLYYPKVRIISSYGVTFSEFILSWWNLNHRLLIQRRTKYWETSGALNLMGISLSCPCLHSLTSRYIVK